MCGQENVEPKESVGHLVRHVTEDITHFDGKFFATLKLLLFKPGFLSEEYLKGRRASYLHPVRMYLFISAFFFLLIFSVSPFEKGNKDVKQRNYKIENGKIKLDTSMQAPQEGIATLKLADSIKNATDTINGKPDSTVASYEKWQASLPENKKDGWLEHYFTKRMVAAREYSHKHPDNFKEKIKENIRHAVSRIFFTSLPIFAFVLYLLYWRRRKTYNYVSHAIFSLHFYCATFIILAGVFLLGTLSGLHFIFTILATLLFLAIFVYEYMAMLRFYKQGGLKTFVKFMLMNICFIVFMLLLTIIFTVDSFLSVV